MISMKQIPFECLHCTNSVRFITFTYIFFRMKLMMHSINIEHRCLSELLLENIESMDIPWICKKKTNNVWMYECCNENNNCCVCFKSTRFPPIIYISISKRKIIFFRAKEVYLIKWFNWSRFEISWIFDNQTNSW